MSKERDSKKRIAFVQLFAEAAASAVPDEIQVVPTGKWGHPVYGEMEITSADIAEFVTNFNAHVRRDIPITAGHDNGMSGGELPAIGWFTDAIDRGVNGLWCGTKWTEEGKQLLTDGSFKYFSPEFFEQYTDPETGEKYGHVLVGGALTNKPYFKELEPVATFSEPGIMKLFNEDMNLKDILSKKPEDLSDAEKAFVRDHKSELSAEESTAFANVLGDAGETDEEKAAREAKEAEDKAAAEPAKTEEERQATERAAKGGKVITMSEAEVDVLRKAADDGHKALQKIEASERTTLVTKMTFSNTNAEGRFLPKQSGALDSFLKTLSEPQRDAFVQLVKNMPKSDASIFTEIGEGGTSGTGDATSIAATVKGLATEKVKASEGKLTYSAALLQVFSEKPELKADYEKALAEGN